MYNNDWTAAADWLLHLLLMILQRTIIPRHFLHIECITVRQAIIWLRTYSLLLSCRKERGNSSSVIVPHVDIIPCARLLHLTFGGSVVVTCDGHVWAFTSFTTITTATTHEAVPTRHHPYPCFLQTFYLLPPHFQSGSSLDRLRVSKRERQLKASTSCVLATP